MALTRIYNNQITNATIYANAKIVPGSIVGSLFNSNLTFTSDVTITGNLTVLGNNKVTSLSSTNTFVNDPLIVLNNGFAGSNTYDEGLVFNRGAAYNAAFIWNESNSEFRFISNTTEQGTTYGTINQNTLGNVRVGNLNVNYSAEVAGNVDAQGGITTQGNIFVNGTAVGSIRTASTTFNLLNDTATTVNEYGAATGIRIGATSGTLLINNPTVVGSQTTQNVFNANATTVNAFQAATTANLGATTGTLQINNPTVVGYNTTQNLWNTVATTVNAFGAASNINLGASAGKVTINSTNNATSTLTGALVVSGGVGIASNLFVGGDTTIQGNLFVLGNTSVFASNNSTFQDSIIELHYLNGGTLTSNDGRDIGLRFHFYTTQNDNAALVRANDTGFLEWYGSGAVENSNVDIGAGSNYGTIKAGNLVLVGNVGGVTSTNFNTGTLVAGGGIGVLGNINVQQNNIITVGGDLVSNAAYPESVAQFTSSANLISRISIQNLSTGTQARAEFTAYATGGSNSAGYITTGILGSGGISGLLATGDGYTRVSQGNLHLNTSTLGKNIYVSAGGGAIANIIAIFDGTNSNLTISSTNIASSPTTGALTVLGGVGISGNLWLGYSGAGNRNLLIQNSQSSVGVFYSPTNQSFIINSGTYSGNLASIPGATFAVRATDSILLPVGATAQRPSNTGNVDIVGMLRYSTTTNTLEWCTASGSPGTWTGPGVSTTVIYDQQINGDGANVSFAVNNASTTNSTIVAINGIIQAPSTAYAMVGGNIVFTEAPAVGDLIDVRTLTATTTISSLSSANGFVFFDVSSADNRYANIVAGSTGPIVRVSVDETGAVNFINNTSIVANNQVQSAPTTNTAVLLDSWTQTAFTGAKYLVRARVDGGAIPKVEAYEAMLVTDGQGNAYVSTFGIVNNGTAFGSFTANVVNSNVQLYYSSTIAQANVKIFATYIQ